MPEQLLAQPKLVHAPTPLIEHAVRVQLRAFSSHSIGTGGARVASVTLLRSAHPRQALTDDQPYLPLQVHSGCTPAARPCSVFDVPVAMTMCSLVGALATYRDCPALPALETIHHDCRRRTSARNCSRSGRPCAFYFRFPVATRRSERREYSCWRGPSRRDCRMIEISVRFKLLGSSSRRAPDSDVLQRGWPRHLSLRSLSGYG